MTTRYTCAECRWHGDQPQRIRLWSSDGAHEFNLVVCPECRHIASSLHQACDEPGCRNDATCGYPTADGGYRQTCHLHMKAGGG